MNDKAKTGSAQLSPSSRARRSLSAKSQEASQLGYNPYEILLQTAKGQLLVFKHAIATIEAVDEPKGFTIER